MSYTCSECHRPVGLMVGRSGEPEPYWCPRAQRMAQAQLRVRRHTRPPTQVAKQDVLRQLRIAKIET
jgi:hypothetical protein